MKKTILLVILIMTMTVKGQLKVYSGGKVAIGSTGYIPKAYLDICIGTTNKGSTRVGDSALTHFYNNESNARWGIGRDYLASGQAAIAFGPGGTTALDSYIGRDGSGNLIFQTNSSSSHNTRLTITSGGDVNLNGSTNSYQINSNKMLWNNNIVSSVMVGVSAGPGCANICNTFVGNKSGNSVTTSTANTAVGFQSLLATTGSNNTAVGLNAGATNTSGSNNTFLGTSADANTTNRTNVTCLGNGATATANNYVVLGNTSVATISGQVNYTTFSDSRVKNNVQENVVGLKFIKKLRPVTYNYDVDKENQIMGVKPDTSGTAAPGKYDVQQITFSGFLAQEVEQAANDVKYDFSGIDKPKNSTCLYGLRYSEFVVPLVKAVQELSSKADSLAAVTHKQDSTINALQKKVNGTSGVGGKKAADDSQDAINKSLQDQINNCCLKANTNGTNSSGAMLYQNIPNPFNQSTNIRCFVPDASKSASLLIFDMNGTLKKTISLNGKGEINTTINGKELVAGMYYYTLVIDNAEVDTKKMILTEQ